MAVSAFPSLYPFLHMSLCPSLHLSLHWILAPAPVSVPVSDRRKIPQCTMYRVNTSLDGLNWTVVDNGRVFSGNLDSSGSTVESRFAEPANDQNVARCNQTQGAI